VRRANSSEVKPRFGIGVLMNRFAPFARPAMIAQSEPARGWTVAPSLLGLAGRHGVVSGGCD
jgi:hypothetical protein